MQFPHLEIHLPDWVGPFLADPDRAYATVEERMLLAIELARQNIAHGTGGPFGAAVFYLDTGRLVAPGVNLVVPAHCSVAHAEIVAIVIAQQAVASFDLGAPGLPPMQLVSSTEPCAMCMGAIPWSGVVELACGARDQDARRIGFDEGPKVPDWVGALAQRGIRVRTDVCREQAVAVLEEYRVAGGEIYNARQGDSAL